MLDRFVESALQDAAMGGASDPHFESGTRQKKARPDGGRSGTVDPRTLAVVTKCREDGLRGPKPIDDRIAARIATSQWQPNKVVERTCISHIARDRVATNKSR
jgi:hypothetical protein